MSERTPRQTKDRAKLASEAELDYLTSKYREQFEITKQVIDKLAKRPDVKPAIEELNKIVHEIWLCSSASVDPGVNSVDLSEQVTLHLIHVLDPSVQESALRARVDHRTLKVYYRKLMSALHPRRGEPAPEMLHLVRSAYKSNDLPTLYSLWLKHTTSTADTDRDLLAKSISSIRGRLSKAEAQLFKLPWYVMQGRDDEAAHLLRRMVLSKSMMFTRHLHGMQKHVSQDPNTGSDP